MRRSASRSAPRSVRSRRSWASRPCTSPTTRRRRSRSPIGWPSCDGRVQQVAPPKELYERPVNRFVADFVGTNNFIAGVCRERRTEVATIETPLGSLRARPAADVTPGQACVMAVRPENVAFGGAADTTVAGRIALASYLGATLRYDVETPGGLVLKVDVGDPWHHAVLGAGEAVTLTFPSSVALTLASG